MNPFFNPYTTNEDQVYSPTLSCMCDPVLGFTCGLKIFFLSTHYRKVLVGRSDFVTWIRESNPKSQDNVWKPLCNLWEINVISNSMIYVSSCLPLQPCTSNQEFLCLFRYPKWPWMYFIQLLYFNLFHNSFLLFVDTQGTTRNCISS